MKNTLNHIVLSTMLLSLFGCGKDDSTPASFEIRLAYEEAPTTSLWQAGTIAPLVIDWNGEVGTFRISAETEAFNRNILEFDQQTGVIKWTNRLPLGEYDFLITASNSKTTTSVNINLKNELISALFVGGFKEDTSEEASFNDIPIEYFLKLNEDNTIEMSKFDDDSFSAIGEWKNNGDGTFNVEFISTASTPEAVHLNGFISTSAGQFRGEYGCSTNQDGSINKQTGIFAFLLD